MCGLGQAPGVRANGGWPKNDYSGGREDRKCIRFYIMTLLLEDVDLSSDVGPLESMVPA